MLIADFAPGEAPCSGLTALFYDEGDEGASAFARDLCEGCPAQVDCLYQAAARRERDGIWGGVSFRAGLLRPAAGQILNAPSEWTLLRRDHDQLLDARGLHAVAAAVVSALRSGRRRRAG